MVAIVNSTITGTSQVYSIVGREHDIDNDEKNINFFFFLDHYRHSLKSI